MELSGLLINGTPVFPNMSRSGYCFDVNGNPVAKRVILINLTNVSILGSCESDKTTGFWKYYNLPNTLLPESILEVSVDDTKQYEAVARCFKTLEV